MRLLVDYSLTGPLAQFSRGAIVRELASALTSQFAANLAQRVQVAALPAHGLVAAAPPSGGTQPLDAGSLLMRAIRSTWQRLLGRLFRRSA